MPDERWIVIPRWDDFQHRDMARTNVPPWIKTYTKLLSNDDYLDLSHHLRGVLLGLWLEYARSTRQLRDSTSAISRRLGQRVTTRDLAALNHAGFITFSASKPASNLAGTTAGLEEKREETPPTPLEKGGDFPGKKRQPRERELTHEEKNPYVCGIGNCTVRHHSEQRIAEHREDVHGIAPASNGHADIATAEPDPQPQPTPDDEWFQ